MATEQTQTIASRLEELKAFVEQNQPLSYVQARFVEGQMYAIWEALQERLFEFTERLDAVKLKQQMPSDQNQLMEEAASALRRGMNELRAALRGAEADSPRRVQQSRFWIGLDDMQHVSREKAQREEKAQKEHEVDAFFGLLNFDESGYKGKAKRQEPSRDDDPLFKLLNF